MTAEEPTTSYTPSPEGPPGSVSRLIPQIKQGTPEERRAAVEEIAARFFQQLVNRLRRKYPGCSEDMATDGAASALCRIGSLVSDSQYGWVTCRGELWALLLTIAGRRALNKLRSERRQKKYDTAADLSGPSDETVFRLDNLPSGGAPVGWEGHVFALLEAARDQPEGPEWSAVVEAAGELLQQHDAKLRLPEILLWKAEGRSNNWIAQQIKRSETTVEKRIGLIRRQLEGEQTHGAP